MEDWYPKPYKHYRWIVADPDLLGGKLAIRGTRISLSLLLECLANDMKLEDINQAFNLTLSQEILAEVFQATSQLIDVPHVAA